MSFALSYSKPNIIKIQDYIDASGNPVLLDGIAFGMQEEDVSWARIPDGGEWSEQATPSPGQEN